MKLANQSKRYQVNIVIFINKRCKYNVQNFCITINNSLHKTDSFRKHTEDGSQVLLSLFVKTSKTKSLEKGFGDKELYTKNRLPLKS